MNKFTETFNYSDLPESETVHIEREPVIFYFDTVSELISHPFINQKIENLSISVNENFILLRYLTYYSREGKIRELRWLTKGKLEYDIPSILRFDDAHSNKMANDPIYRDIYNNMPGKMIPNPKHFIFDGENFKKIEEKKVSGIPYYKLRSSNKKSNHR